MRTTVGDYTIRFWLMGRRVGVSAKHKSGALTTDPHRVCEILATDMWPAFALPLLEETPPMQNERLF